PTPALHSFPTRRSSDLETTLTSIGGRWNQGRCGGWLRVFTWRSRCRRLTETKCAKRRMCNKVTNHRQDLVAQYLGRQRRRIESRDRKSTRLNSSHRTIS